MNLLNFVKNECIATGVSVSNKTECLQKVAQLAKKSSVLKNISEKEIFEALQNREELGSTGFENGIAIPHCRLENVEEFVVGFITIPDGIDFAALVDKCSTSPPVSGVAIWNSCEGLMVPILGSTLSIKLAMQF